MEFERYVKELVDRAGFDALLAEVADLKRRLLRANKRKSRHKKRADSAETDAERYRWIANNGCPFPETDKAWDSRENLDAAVDECIAYEEERA